jgi:hypothetical protein
MKIKKENWKNYPMTSERERLNINKHYNVNELTKIQNGHLPKSMDDKWFIYYQDNWLYFHRSWTGHCIYEVKLKITEGGADIDELWVSRDLEQYRSMGASEDLNILMSLIEYKLLKRK